MKALMALLYCGVQLISGGRENITEWIVHVRTKNRQTFSFVKKFIKRKHI